MSTTTIKYPNKGITSRKKRVERKNYKNLANTSTVSADDYEPAYSYESTYPKYHGRSFDDVESDISRDKKTLREESSSSGDRAYFSYHDAWNSLNTRR